MAAKAYLNLAKEQLANEGKAFESEVPLAVWSKYQVWSFLSKSFSRELIFYRLGPMT